MAKARCFPPSLLDDPDYFELDGDTQAILVGLVLCADDHGRGLAHTSWLARKLNRDVSVIEAALARLEASHMIQRYQVEQQQYYLLLKWWIWQAGLRKPARPLYPAPPSPPDGSSDDGSPSPTLSEKVRESSTFSDKVEKPPLEGEEEEIESESEEEDEGEREHYPPTNVVTFPTSPRDDDGDEQKKRNIPERELTQVARILRLPPDEALLRIVQDYRASPGLSLLGEADSARAWIDDPRRNKSRKNMTVGFFRNWLKRECESRKLRQEAPARSQPSPPESISAPRAQSGTRAPSSTGAGLAGQSLMDLEQRYKASASRDSPSGSTPQNRREGGQKPSCNCPTWETTYYDRDGKVIVDFKQAAQGKERK
jgi:hypothetical protein